MKTGCDFYYEERVAVNVPILDMAVTIRQREMPDRWHVGVAFAVLNEVLLDGTKHIDFIEMILDGL